MIRGSDSLTRRQERKPRYYINGLFELKEAYRVYNANEEREWLKTNDDDKPYKEKKLQHAFICSGEA